MNLFEDTIESLEENGKTFADVKYITCDTGNINVEDFKTIAKNTEFCRGYGRQEVAADLMIVGENWILVRLEYDGFEWWEFLNIQSKPEIKILHLASKNIGTPTIERLNQNLGNNK